MTSTVSLYPDVTEFASVTEGDGVTTYKSVIAGDVESSLVLMSGGIFLLMTGGSLALM